MRGELIIHHSSQFKSTQSKLSTQTRQRKKPLRKCVINKYIGEVPIIEVVLESLKDEPLPLIILYHGWKNSKELMLTQARRLADIRMRVILPDAMHHGKRRSGEVSSLPSFTFWSSIHYSIAEYDLLVRTYEARNLILKAQIGIGGYSMGAITTFMLFARSPSIVSAVAIMGSPYAIRYRERVKTQAKRLNYSIPDDFDQLFSWIKHYDLSLYPERINHRPLFIWHGTDDERVPYKHSADFYGMIKDKSYAEQVQFMIGEGERHFVTTALMDQIAIFFEETLKF